MRAILLLSLLAPALARPSTTPKSIHSRDSDIPKAASRAVHVNAELEFSSPNPSSNLIKRFTFTAGGRNEYCGESNPTEDFGPGAPLQADCAALGQSAASATPGFYTLHAADFDAATGWCTIATSGTCSFAVRFQRREEADTEVAMIGTHDVTFYVQRYILDARDGRIGAVGTMACYNGTPGKMLLMEWGLIRP